MVDRQFLPGVFRVFDFANPDLHIPQRAATTIPQQALFFLNGKLVADRAGRWRSSETIAGAPDDAERVRRMYRIALPARADGGTGVGRRSRSCATTHVPRRRAAAAAGRRRRGSTATASTTPSADRIDGLHAAAALHRRRVAGRRRTGRTRRSAGCSSPPTGGHAGNDLAHAAVRRWVAPRDMTVRIDGTVAHEVRRRRRRRRPDRLQPPRHARPLAAPERRKADGEGRPAGGEAGRHDRLRRRRRSAR